MPSCTGGLSYHSASYVEDQVIDWFKKMLDFPRSRREDVDTLAREVVRNTSELA